MAGVPGAWQSADPRSRDLPRYLHGDVCLRLHYYHYTSTPLNGPQLTNRTTVVDRGKHLTGPLFCIMSNSSTIITDKNGETFVRI